MSRRSSARSRSPRGEVGTPSKPLRVVTDCSGMDAPIFALQELGVSYLHGGAGDNAAPAKNFWNAHHQTTSWCDDITLRNHHVVAKERGDTDLYVSGFPCQPWSRNGKNQGEDDEHGRGTIVHHIIQYIEASLPTAFILENVEGMVTSHPETVKMIIQCLKLIRNPNHCGVTMYQVDAKVLNSKEHGVPQNRPRLYIIGYKKNGNQTLPPYEWPNEIACPDIKHVLAPATQKAITRNTPPASAKHAQKQLLLCMRNIMAANLHPFKDDCICDIDSSKPHWMHNCSPCLTHARASGHWVSSRGRRLSIDERLRLMGMDPKHIKKDIVTERQLGGLIGNSMSVNVIERILIRLLSSTGLVPRSAMRHSWETTEQSTSRLKAMF